MRPRLYSFALAIVTLLLAPTWASAAVLSVTADAALEGNFGMKITYDGSTNQVFVQDNTPDGESTYNYEFRYNFNNTFIPLDGTQSVMLVRSDLPRNDMRVFMWCRNAACGLGGGGGQNNLVFQLRRDTGGGTPWAHCARLSQGPNANVLWRVELVKGSGADDGVCRVFKNGVLTVEELNMPSDELDLDAHRWGGLSTVNPAIAGSTFNDSFVSTR